jgi:hypothetical protein
MAATGNYRTLVLHASDIASFVGRHKFQPQRQTILKYVNKLDPLAYQRIAAHDAEQERLLHICSQNVKVVAELNKVAELNSSGKRSLPPERREQGRIVYECIRSQMPIGLGDIQSLARTCMNGSPDRMRSSLQHVSKAIDEIVEIEAADTAQSAFTARDAELAKEYCRAELYGAYGTQQEAPVREQQQQLLDVTKDDVYRKRFLCEILNDLGEGLNVDGEEKNRTTRWRIYVGGKCDGIGRRPTDGKRVVLEIKNRVSRLFRSVPEYERIQIMCYLFVLGMDEALLLERYRDDSMEHGVTFDEVYWRELQQGIQDAARSVVSMIQD